MSESFKTVQFRLVDYQGKPIAWAFIKAQVLPQFHNAWQLNTTFPTTHEFRTNQYGMASVTLLTSSSLEVPGTQYLITLTYNGKSYFFEVELTEDMPEFVDFETLVDRQTLVNKLNCESDSKNEGVYKIIDGKLWL